MKKTLAMAILLLLSAALLLLPAAAESKTFVDTLEDNYPLVYEKSDKMRFELNKDLDKTLYEKWVETGASPSTEEYVVYKLDGDITGFTIDCLHVNGLGDANTDIGVALSKDGKSWTAAKVKVSDQTFDDEIYINEETAYWKMSSVTNDGTCPAGYTYIKVTILPFTKKDSVPWNTVLDTISVNYNAQGETPATTGSTNAPTQGNTGTNPKTEPPVTDPNASTTAPESSGETTSGNTEVTTTSETAAAGLTTVPESSQSEEKGGSALPFIIAGIVIVVLAGGGVGAYFFMKKKNTHS